MRLFSRVPAGTGIVFLHGCGNNAGLFSEILLIHDSIMPTIKVTTPDDRYTAG